MPSCVSRNSGASSVYTRRPTIALSISRRRVDAHDRGAVIDRIEVVGLARGVDRHGARPRGRSHSSSDRCASNRATAPRSAGCGRTSTATRRSAADDEVAELLDPLANERGLVRRDELRRAEVKQVRLSRVRPTRAQNASRDVLGCQANQWSNGCAPVTTTRSGGTPCSSMASCFMHSFHTVTRSRRPWISPLFVRLSQLATHRTVRMLRARAARTYSLCGDPGSMSGETSEQVGLLVCEKRVDRVADGNAFVPSGGTRSASAERPARVRTDHARSSARSARGARPSRRARAIWARSGSAGSR